MMFSTQLCFRNPWVVVALRHHHHLAELFFILQPRMLAASSSSGLHGNCSDRFGSKQGTSFQNRSGSWT
jgi:hypothetical protein